MSGCDPHQLLPPKAASYRNKEGICMIFSFLVPLCVYLSTSFPSVTGGDSGELSYTACVGSTAHPPGYPLLTLLSFPAIRAGAMVGATPARSLNVMACFLGAAAAAFVALCVGEAVDDELDAYGRRPPAGGGGATWRGMACAWVAAMLFALSPTVWLYSIQHEVFALNNALCAALLWLTARVVRDGRQADITGGCVVIALSLANQHTSVLFIIPCAISVIFAWPARAARLLSWAVVSAAAGLSLYLYLPFAQLYLNPTAKLGWGDFSSPVGLARHILRMDYGTFRLMGGGEPTPYSSTSVSSPSSSSSSSSPIDSAAAAAAAAKELLDSHSSVITARVRLWVDHVVTESAMASWLPLAALLGLLALIIQRRGLVAVAWVGGLTVNLAVFFLLANARLHEPVWVEVLRRFWMQPFIVVCVLAGRGFGLFFRHLPQTRALKAISLTLGVAVVVLQWRTWVRENDRSADTIFADFGRLVLLSAPAKAILLVSGDHFYNAPGYFMSCQGERPDVDLLSSEVASAPWFPAYRPRFRGVTFPGELMFSPAYNGYDLNRFFQANLRKRPIIVCGISRSDSRSWVALFTLAPAGLCHSVHRVGLPLPDLEVWMEQEKLFYQVADKAIRGPLLAARRRVLRRPGSQEPLLIAGSWENIVVLEYLRARLDAAMYMLSRYAEAQNGAEGKKRVLGLAARLADDIILIGSWPEFAAEAGGLSLRSLDLKAYAHAHIFAVSGDTDHLEKAVTALSAYILNSNAKLLPNFQAKVDDRDRWIAEIEKKKRV